MLPEQLEPLEAALAHRYRFVRELGRGGWGIVYLADDLATGRKVALKTLRIELGSTRAEERFAREIDIVTRLVHPNIVPVLEQGDVEGTKYFAMPLIEGETLAQRMRRERQLPIGEALSIAKQVARALEFAHRADVVHRDIKPSNILLDGGQALIADFGIARAISRAAPLGWQSSNRTQVGTVEYMSPEQAAGDDDIDGRSDVYSLGCVLYEMLAGAPPFTGATPAGVLARHAFDPVPSLRTVRQSVSSSVERVIIRALAKAPADRYETAEAFSAALEEATAGTQQTPDEATRPTVERTRRKIVSRAAASAAVLALAAGLPAAIWFSRERSSSANWREKLDPQLIAVAPFSVVDPELSMWREGLVDILSRSLDAAGPIRTVSPTRVLRRWTGRADENSVSALGRRTGARFAVYGTLVRSGRDSIRVSAAVYDVSKSKSIGETEITEPVEHVDHMADRLTIAVLRDLGQSGGAQVADVRLAAAAGSASLPALKAFLQAEYFFRRTAWDSASVYYERAVGLDPRQPLALFRLSLVTRWQSLNGDSLSSAYALQADAVNHGLAPRESLMVHAGALFSKITRGFADTAYWRDRSELFSSLAAATQRYPNEAELWYAVAEARYRADASARGALEAYDRAISIDSGFAPAYPDAVIMAMALRGSLTARRYLDAYLRLKPTDVHADGYRLAARLLDLGVQAPSLRATLDTASADVLQHASGVTAYLPDSGETAVYLARSFAAGRSTRTAAFADSTFTSFQIAHLLAFRGHLREAVKVLGTQPTELARVPGSQYLRATIVASLMMLGAVPQHEADRFFAQLAQAAVDRPTGLIMALPWWSERHDTASLQRVLGRAQSIVSTSGKRGVEGPYAQYLATAARAYLALARHDSASALNYLLNLPEPGCMYPYCPFERLVAARLLAARGENTRAAAILDDVPNFYSPIGVLWRFHRAEVAEHLGRRDVAVQEYQYVADAWARADSIFQPTVASARAGLRRLDARRAR